MAKVPYVNNVLQYRLCGDHYKAEKVFMYVSIRDVVSSVTVQALVNLSTCNASLVEKLSHCPFIVLIDNDKHIAITLNEVIENWTPQDCPIIDTEEQLSNEMNIVPVNVYAPITCYEEDTVGYSFKEAGQLFCSMMGFPWILSKDMHWLHNVRSVRRKHIDVQIDRSRVILGHKGRYAYYHGGNFSLVKEFSS